MGFSTLIDILGSSLIGGILFMILLRLNDASVENTYVNAGELMLQQNLVEVASVIEFDFRKIGYCKEWSKIPDPATAILYADSSSISFLTDVKNEGNVDTLHYYLGPTSELSNTSNPRDRILYRVVNSSPALGANSGITRFELKYFDDFGNEINTPVAVTSQIRNIQIDLKVENSEVLTSYSEPGTQIVSSAFWRQIRMAARNLRNR